MTSCRYRMLGLLCLTLWVVEGCNRQSPTEHGVLARIRKAGTLVVLTRNAPTTYYIGRDGAMGFEHDLVTAFAASLGVAVRFKIRSSVGAILDGMAKGEADIAAAGLTRTAKRQQRFLYGPDYYDVQQQVVCHREDKQPKQVQDLQSVSLLIIAKSSYEERLQELRQTLPRLRWRASHTLSTEEILARVWQQNVDCTVADSNIVALNRRYYPELDVAFALTEVQPLGWILRPGGTDLQEALQHWFAGAAQRQLLETLRHRYYSHVDLFNYVDLKTFHRHVEQRLPGLRPLFEQAAEAHGFPWTLLAAQAYQESHWNPKAKSPTGVRGLMMLTQPTARSLGVRNRLDARQSIEGGAAYMARLRERIPEEVQGVHRWWFTLAAYNIGMSHLSDAMTLSKRLRKNPHVWYDLRQVLPLLAKRQYFKSLPNGYARGSEPVLYVRRIRNYREMLEAYLHRNGYAQQGGCCAAAGR